VPERSSGCAPLNSNGTSEEPRTTRAESKRARTGNTSSNGEVSEGAADSSSSSTAASWTSNGVAPATPEEIKVASYLIISAAFDDFVPEVNITIPRKLTHFIDEVTDGAVRDASLKSAKDWLDSTGQCPHYINPVHVVMSSKFNLSLDLMSTYRWRTKLTASASDRTRLCASSNGKHKTSRLKDMLPTVARFILAQGPDKMWAELVAAREADTQSSDRSPTKAAVKRKLTEAEAKGQCDQALESRSREIQNQVGESNHCAR